MKNIYGTIGYTILQSDEYQIKIIIMADMHDKLPQCENKINVSEWFKNKLHTSKILLEEVPRDDVNLIELWSNSIHTQELKNLYLQNPKNIQAVDVRPFLVLFSWEIIDINNKSHDISLYDYLKSIDNFFTFNHVYFLNKIPFYGENKIKNTKLGEHYLKIKKNYINFLNKYRHLMNKKVYTLTKTHRYVLEELNEIMSEIMEWNICGNIVTNKNQSIILHAGLAHSEKTIEWLKNHYGFKLIIDQGINKIIQTFNNPLNGCVKLPFDLDVQFGGFSHFLLN
jgi:hypothetical protein